jgi:release factor glutamine methyltransferase
VTIAEALHRAEARLQGAGVEDARLEAELLLGHALGISRERLYVRLPEEIEAAELARCEVLLLRRLGHVPLAYITGHREFYGLELACTPDALIPRPETELLVELALEWCQGSPDVPYPTLVDVGTGNGAIAVAIAVHALDARVIAIDRSRAALRLARENAREHGVAQRIAFVQGDLVSMLGRSVDVIVANLPYVPTRLYEKLPPEIREHEPSRALHAGRRGTDVIERLIRQSPPLLRPGGLLLAEHAWNQGRTLREAARRSFPNARIETRRDLSGKERVLVVNG